MLSVVIPTFDDESRLVPTLSGLVAAAAEGVVRDVTVSDRGSTDATLEIADLAGCNVVATSDRGAGLDAAARRAKGSWLLFLEPGVTLEDGWHREVCALVASLERSGEAGRRAAVFGYGIDGFGEGRRTAERMAWLSRLLTGLPRPEQGLIISKAFYERSGGFRSMPAMAEIDLIRRIGAGRLVRLRTKALAPAERSSVAVFGGSGLKRALGAWLLMLRVPTRFVARLYG